ncbi:MscS Mechanosensitive Ion Channel [Agrobacterium tumefaciens]|nr:MscS Mechanosensitive Ion Channel [Agrobacterium tumefaciens]
MVNASDGRRRARRSINGLDAHSRNRPMSILADPLIQFGILVLLRVLAAIIFPGARLLRLLLNVLFFTGLTTLLLYHGIAPYLRDDDPSSFAARIANGALKTIWWVGGAMVLASCVRLFLTFERKPREGRLLQDLVIALIYVVAALCIVAYVFNLPVGTVIATSGVFAIVLGLALQSTLNDVFSGIALNLGRPISVSDWIILDENVQGRVIETNWRSTHLLSGTNDLVVVPNSVLAKSRITNVSGPDAVHGASLRIRLQPTRHPGIILDAMDRVLLSSNAILKKPVPTAAIVSVDREAVEIELSFRVENSGMVTAAKNELFDLSVRHAEAAGLQLAASAGSLQVSIEQLDAAKVLKKPATPMRLMNSIPLFSGLTEEEKEELAANMNRLTFRKGEIISRWDTALTSLMIVRSGVVAIEERDDKETLELSRLAPGDFFGERGVLLGALEFGDYRALTAAVIYEVPKDKLAQIMRERPAIAEELALLLDNRTRAEEALHRDDHPHGSAHQLALSKRIRQLFMV